MQRQTTSRTLMAKLMTILLLTQPLAGTLYAMERPSAPAISLAELIPWEAAKEGQGLEMRASLVTGERDYLFQLQGGDLRFLDLLNPSETGTLSFATFAQKASVRMLSTDESGSFLASLELPGPLGAKIRYLLSAAAQGPDGKTLVSVTLPDHSRTFDILVDAGSLGMMAPQKLVCGGLCITLGITAVAIVGTIVTASLAISACADGANTTLNSCITACGAGNVQSMGSGDCGTDPNCICQAS